MNFKTKQFSLSCVATAVMFGLGANVVHAEEDGAEDVAIEEVVVTANRLKGSATAVLEERKQQAFVADILGAEQISRTGDGDAASALRRVTGLTLVDGKFIYVRGLGERYSSTQLNGAMVPSPDPTRNVIPLDLFPAAIIESLSVQKSYSPSMPAHFGGGNVDIRLKTIPDEFTLKLSGSLGSNSENTDDAIGYSGGGNDWLGKDDGTRSAPKVLADLWDGRTYLNDISKDQNREIATLLNRDFDVQSKSVEPEGSFDFAVGDTWDIDDWRLGALLTGGYSNGWNVSKQFEGQLFTLDGDKRVMSRGYDDVISTEHEVKWSVMANFGVDYNRNHKLDFSSLVLHDTKDQIKEKFGNTENAKITDQLRIRDVNVLYEERQLFVNQIKGMHTFPQWNFAGFDWKYSDSKSYRYAPGNVETRYMIFDANGDDVFSMEDEVSLARASTASRFSYQDLDDAVENIGWNASLPYTLGKWEMEFKTGADYVEKRRYATARRFDIDTRVIQDTDYSGDAMNDILTDELILNADYDDALGPLLRDTTADGDDYHAAQKIDAYYFEADFFFNDEWRISGGVRWEDFRQVVVGLKTDGTFDVKDIDERAGSDAELLALAFKEDKFYPALAMTYIYSPEMQFRFSYGETTVRPDLREVSNSTYLDPLTLDPIRGTPGLRPTQMKNYDARWEWYMDNGDNLSVGLFYKDMLDPIESVQSPAQDGPPLIVMANAQTGELTGVELEFLKGMSFVSDFGVGDFWNNMFVSGNLTLSDSEIQIDPQSVVDQAKVSTAITNTTRRLTGHSEWVLNLQFGYDSTDGNHSSSLVYNVFGDRIILPGIEGQDDSYEQPFHSVDFIYTYYPSYNSKIKLKLQNILNERKEIEFENTLRRSETKGVGFSLSYSYDF